MILLGPRVKLTKRPNRVQPEVFLAISVAENVFESFGLSARVASLLDGHNNHHLLGYEVDFEVPGDQLIDVADGLRTALLDSYVVRPENKLIHVVFLHD